MTALAPYRRGDLRRGKTSVVELAANGVAVDVRIDRVDKRNRCSWYALRLASAETGVTSRLVGVRRSGEVDDLGTVEVACGSMSSARFAVTTPRTGAYRAMFLEIVSDRLLLRVEAPLPPAVRGLRPFKVAAALFAVGVAASCAGAVPLAFAQASDRVGAVPAVTVLPVAPPKPVAQPAPARVLSFSARRDATPGGESVLASYLAVGERGTIALLDGAGTIVASAPFTRVGTVRLPVPRAYRTLPMTAQITVHRGATKAVSGVAVPPNFVKAPLRTAAEVAAADDASIVAAAGVPGEAITPIDSQSSAEAGGIVVVEGRAVAGRPLKLRLASQASPMHVELENADGETIADREVAPGATRASLQLPAGTVRTTYLLALHFTHNGGEETVIRTITAAVR